MYNSYVATLIGYMIVLFIYLARRCHDSWHLILAPVSLFKAGGELLVLTGEG